jgi:hypothetical protein
MPKQHVAPQFTEIKCGETVLIDAYVVVRDQLEAKMKLFAQTICDIQKNDIADTDTKIDGVKKYADVQAEAMASALAALDLKVQQLASNPPPKDGVVMAEVQKAIDEAIAKIAQVNPDQMAQLNVLLTLIQQAPELRNIASLIARIDAIDARVKALEDTAMDAEEVDCRIITATKFLAEIIVGGIPDLSAQLIACRYGPAGMPVKVAA